MKRASSITVGAFLAVGVSFALVATVVVGLGADSAAAAPTPPPYYKSYYMDTASRSALYDLGCAHGKADKSRAGTQRSVVILNFGAVYYSSNAGTYYATLFDGSDTRLTAVRDAVKQYGYGYLICTEADTESSTTVALGTNNSAGTITSAAGSYFANRVDEIGAYFDSLAYNQVFAAGANDIELGWSSPTVVRNWLNGYDSANSYRMFDYGDAAGCPTTRIPSGNDCGTAAHPEWTAEDVWFKSWGSTPVFPVPEIYTTSGSQAKQRKYLSLYAYTQHGSRMNFVAALTQYHACLQIPSGCSGMDNTPGQGWTQLYDQLNSDSRSADTSFYSTDIRYS
jgi:hypothetical protein